MTKRWTFTIQTYGEPDRMGLQSFDITTHDAKTGKTSFQTYRGKPRIALAHLRHNIAEEFWFDRWCRRVWKGANIPGRYVARVTGRDRGI